MNTLERLRELEATRGRAENEDLGHWADREKHENLWVRDVALPLLLDVVEAAKALCNNVNDDTGEYEECWQKLYAALAKLEAPDEH